MKGCKVTSRFLMFMTITVSVLMGLSTVAQSQPASYESGYHALQVWDDAAMKIAPPLMKAWLAVLLGSFALGLLFVWRHAAARWLVGGFLLMMVFGAFAVPALNLVSLSGLVALLHIVFWTPVLIMMLKERAFFKGLSFYNVWAGLITLVIIISFVFDIRDAAIYLDHMLGFGVLA